MTDELGDGFILRPATGNDHAAMSRVCLQTGDAGKDASGLDDDPELLGLVYAVPYQIFAPEFAFVLEGTDGVCGYVLGALDTNAFNERMARDWFPKLRERVRDPGPDRAKWTGSDWVRDLIYRPDGALPPALAPYPSHGHIDLLAAAQGHGFGRRLMAQLEQALTAAGSPGIHLGVNPANTSAQKFYAAVGYTLVDAWPDGITFAKRLG